MTLQKRRSATGLLFYGFVIWMLYVSDSMLFALNNNRSLMRYAGYTLIAVGLVMGALLYFTKSLDMERVWLLIVSLFILIAGFAHAGTMPSSIKRIATLCLGCFMAKKMNTRRLIDAFCNVMAFIAVVSLLGFFFPDFFSSFGFLPRLVTSTREMESISLFFTNIPAMEWYRERNWGPFWEPGAYQAFLNLALMFTLFLRSKHFKYWWLHAIVFIVAIITTLSTTGYVALAMVFLAFVVNRRQNQEPLRLSRVLIVLAGIVVLLFIAGESGLYQSVVSDKLANEESSRFQFVWYGLRAFLKSPLVGHGAALAGVITAMAGTGYSFTNTFVANFAVFGIVPGTYTLVRYLKTCGTFKGALSLPVKLFLGIALFAMLSGEYFMYSPTFAWLMFVDFSRYTDGDGATAGEQPVAESAL